MIPMRPLLVLGLLAGAAALASAQPQRLPPPPVPPQNPITTAKASLGKALFWDEQMSSTRTVSCATCHLPETGGADGRARFAVHPGRDQRFQTPDDVHGSPGVVASNANGTYFPRDPFPMQVQVTGRKALSVLMSAYGREKFWDGRAGERFDDPVTRQTLIPLGASLETQATEPPLSDVEMAHVGADWPGIAQRLAASRPLALASDLPPALATWIGTRSYPELFREAFGSPEVSPARIAMAIATYERTLVPNQAPIDAFLAGDQTALTPQERRGFEVFNGPARCVTCHAAPFFDRPGFFNIGVRPIAEDRGRAAITDNPADEGAFKVPSLRNVAQRAPFFHNGGKRTLEEVIDFYARGGDFHDNQTNLIRPFQLGPQDRDALLAFLRSALTDPRAVAALPPFDHPTLYALSGRVPAAYGTGGRGSAGFVPRLVALEPPVLGNPKLALALAQGLGGAPAVLLLDGEAGSGNPVLGLPLWVAATPALQVLPLGGLRGVGPGQGWTSFTWPIPAAPSLAGVSIYLQGVVVDPGALAGDLSGTAGVRLTMFAAR